MSSVQNCGWLGDNMNEIQAAECIWSSQATNDQKIYGADFESCERPGKRACREKMRRDKINDRFSDLCHVLEPGAGAMPNPDKLGILSKALRLLNQLRGEVQKLKEKIEMVQDSINSLKAEKTELREEKLKLKAEKEMIEQVVKSMSFPCHIPAMYATDSTKTIPYQLDYNPPAMWQWVPPASLDTSEDHVLRPPVA